MRQSAFGGQDNVWARWCGPRVVYFKPESWAASDTGAATRAGSAREVEACAIDKAGGDVVCTRIRRREPSLGRISGLNRRLRKGELSIDGGTKGGKAKETAASWTR